MFLNLFANYCLLNITAVGIVTLSLFCIHRILQPNYVQGSLILVWDPPISVMAPGPNRVNESQFYTLAIAYIGYTSVKSFPCFLIARYAANVAKDESMTSV